MNNHKIKSILRKNGSRYGKNKVYDDIIKRQEKINKNQEEIVMRKNICVWINTYNRPEELDNLLGDILRDKEDFNITIFIFDDYSTENYKHVLEKYEYHLNIIYKKERYNHGKQKYWSLCSKAIRKMCSGKYNFDYYIKLDDDGRLVNRFFYKAVNVWESVRDTNKVSLNFRVDSREGNRVWTNFRPRLIKNIEHPVYLSQWVDMDFICERTMFSALGYKITPQPMGRWTRDPSKSSGTGEDISRRLVSKGYRLYMTAETLVMHDEHESIMNPEERQKNPLITKDPNERYGL